MSEPLHQTVPRELSNPVTQGPAKHHKKDDHQCFHPELSTTSRGQLLEWIRAPITGKLDEVPGIGPANITHLSTINEATKEHGGDEVIDSTHQLLGKYLFFKSLSVSNVENAQLFYNWLKMKGITSRRDSIVEAVAEKVNIMIPGIYAAEEFEPKKESEKNKM